MKYSTVSYLMHHGIEGQKWGVRRWQNKDGSLTPEGKIHYGIGSLDTNSKFTGSYKEGKKAFRAEKSKLYKKLGDTNYADETKVGLEASLKYEQDYNKKHKDIRNKLLKSTGFDIDKDENQVLYFDTEALEMLVDEHNKNSKDKLNTKDVDYYFNKESNPDDWDTEWEQQQNEIISKNYDSAKKYVDGYLNDKYGEELVAKVAKADAIKGKVATIAVVSAIVAVPVTIVAVEGVKAFRNGSNKDKSESPDLDETLKSEAKKRGISDEEFNKITKPNSAQKERNVKED